MRGKGAAESGDGRGTETERWGAVDKERNGWFGAPTPDLTPVQVIRSNTMATCGSPRVIN